MTTTFSSVARKIPDPVQTDLEEALKNNDDPGYWYEAGRHEVPFHVAEQFHELWQNGGIKP